MPVKLRKISITIALPILLGLILSSFSGIGEPAFSSIFQPERALVVLANPDDPYYSLAEDIAAAENVTLVNSVQDATACRPKFLLWVVSPTSLSDAVMIEFGMTMKEQPSAISTGIITASTLEGARELWERRSDVRGEHVFALNAPNTAAHIYEGRVIAFDGKQTTISPLTTERFGEVLKSADYLTFTGHGGSRVLRLDDTTAITASDIPDLGPIVVATGSCQTLQPWREKSIAIGFIDQGAAAYSGFVFSPNEGFLIGEFDGLPFRYTWPDFPIGQALQVQNHGTLQGFAFFPYHYLIGDPRIALQTEPPYRLVDDRQEGSWRILTFDDVPSGVIPIRITDGAAYHFVAATGITAASDRDLFYNSRMQMVNIGTNKFILVVHKGGELMLRMRHRAPWYWVMGDLLLDSLDHTLVFMPQTGGDVFSMIFAVIPLVWAIWLLVKNRFDWQKARLAAAFGLGAAILQAIYVLVRLDDFTTISKIAVFSPTGIVAAFVLTMFGALMYFHARRWKGKVVALSVMTFTSWSSMVIVLAMLAGVNILFANTRPGPALYNYSICLLPAGTLLVSLALSVVILRAIDRLQRGALHQKVLPEVPAPPGE
ncbi:MAG: hypothetical protein JXB07_11995 [Anaerolineae bacterium]|nr:hypothetical protein [Anaerolineae bacterium]